MAAHQQHVGAHGVAADIDVIGQRGEHPYAASTVQAPRRLEVDRAPEQLVARRNQLLRSSAVPTSRWGVHQLCAKHKTESRQTVVQLSS